MKNSILLICIIFLLFSCKQNKKFTTLKGLAFGTQFIIKYDDDLQRDFSKSVDSLIKSVNKSLSTYEKTSDISRINAGDLSVIVDEKFKEVFNKSRKIFDETNGVFDPTIGVLVNAWDFGPEKPLKLLDSSKVKALMQAVGFDKVHLQNNKIIKENSQTYLDFNAIAKGYGIDVIGRFFESKHIKNYMIEIGGELRVRGKNPSSLDWNIQIEQPNFDGTRSGAKTIRLNNESMATSGTYRKFKMDKNGHKYAHILNSKTGFPIKSNLLSASVIAELDCADVDAYATTLIALGLERSKAFLKNHPELTVFLIYSDENGALKTFQTDAL
ncbi:MAG: FAD:protein FMN transferase [Flavobacteriaceae bacterium]